MNPYSWQLVTLRPERGALLCLVRRAEFRPPYWNVNAWVVIGRYLQILFLQVDLRLLRDQPPCRGARGADVRGGGYGIHHIADTDANTEQNTPLRLQTFSTVARGVGSSTAMSKQR
jgi:hypothetical protein